MKKTMIYLETLQHEGLCLLSKRERKSFSQTLREAVACYLKQKLKSASPKKDPLWHLVGLGKAKESNQDSLDHDALLYGSQK